MKKIYFTILSLTLTISSCTDDNYDKTDIGQTTISTQSKKNHFPLDSAIIYAKNIELFRNSFSENTIKNKKQTPTEKKIIGYKKVKNSKHSDSFYIINYEKGFVILSADKRINPILAFSDSNNFEMEASKYPEGLQYWLNATSEGILNITESEANDTIKNDWKQFSTSNYKISAKIPIEEPDCTPYNIIKGPYINTTWGQGYGYNDLTPNLNCSNYIGGNAPTGCVATTLAQIIFKFQKPSTFNYDYMKLSYGTYETAVLMKDIGSKVDMKYSCGGSSSSTTNAYNALKSYGYTNVKKEGYNYQKVKDILDSGYPVIISGGHKTGGLFPTLENGHMWIIDGYTSYIDPCWGSTLRFHMNWGWNGQYDGYYSFSNFYVPELDLSFNDSNEIIYNF